MPWSCSWVTGLHSRKYAQAYGQNPGAWTLTKRSPEESSTETCCWRLFMPILWGLLKASMWHTSLTDGLFHSGDRVDSLRMNIEILYVDSYLNILSSDFELNSKFWRECCTEPWCMNGDWTHRNSARLCRWRRTGRCGADSVNPTMHPSRQGRRYNRSVVGSKWRRKPCSALILRQETSILKIIYTRLSNSPDEDLAMYLPRRYVWTSQNSFAIKWYKPYFGWYDRILDMHWLRACCSNLWGSSCEGYLPLMQCVLLYFICDSGSTWTDSWASELL